eukprot:3010322-Rhodomonas_salina.1
MSAFHDSKPRNWKEARASPQWEMWKAAEALELKMIWKMGTFEICDRPLGVTCLPSQMVNKLKYNKHCNLERYKVHVVARGDLQQSH